MPSPFSCAYACRVVSFIATPRLSIIVKLPFAAPATASIASFTSTPMMDATSEARCITACEVAEAYSSPKPEPFSSAPILFAFARYSDCESPMSSNAVFALFFMESA